MSDVINRGSCPRSSSLEDQVEALRALLRAVHELVLPPRPASPAIDVDYAEFCRLSEQREKAFTDLQRSRAVDIHAVLECAVVGSRVDVDVIAGAVATLRRRAGELPYPPRAKAGVSG